MQSGKDTSVLMCLFIIPNSGSYEPGTLRMKNNLIKRAAIQDRPLRRGLNGWYACPTSHKHSDAFG